MINGNSTMNFEYETLINSRLLRERKEQMVSPPSDLEVKIEEGKEFFHQRHTYKFKEQILYNTLSSKYFKESNFDMANLNYYQNFFRSSEDFISRNRNLIQNLRNEYINGGYLKKKENEDEEKKSKLEILSKLKKSKSDNKANKEMMISVGNLSMVLKDRSDDINRDMKLIIILRFLENILLQFEYTNEEFINNSEIEKNLCNCLSSFENEFVNKDINEKIIEILEKFEIIAMIFQSSALLIKILLLLKQHNISLNNFSSLYSKFFKHSLKANSLFSFRVISKNEKSPSLLSFNYDINRYTLIADNDYVYLIINTKENIWHIIKLKLIKEKITIIKESVVTLNDVLHINLIDNNDEIYIYTINTSIGINVHIIDKENLNLISNHKISSDLIKYDSIITTFTSKSIFYIMYTNSVIEIDLQFKVSKNNFKVKSDDFGDFTVNDLKNKKDYFFLNDEYIFFPLHFNLVVYKRGKKKLRMYLNYNIHLNEISNDPIFYNSNNNICYSTKVAKNVISIQELGNKKSNFVNFPQMDFPYS